SQKKYSFRRPERDRPQGSPSTLVLSVTRYKVGAIDLLIRNRNDPFTGRDRDLLLGGADQLTHQALVAVAGVAKAHTRLLPEKAAVVLGLGQRSILARRGHLNHVLLAVAVEQACDLFTVRERDAVGMVDEQTQRVTGNLYEQDLD